MSEVEVPRFQVRPEGDGYIVYLPDTGTYLYANALTHDLLEELRTRGAGQVATTVMTAQSIAPGEQSTECTRSVIRVLSGKQERLDEKEGCGLLLGPLSDVVDNVERCETFGMPL